MGNRYRDTGTQCQLATVGSAHLSFSYLENATSGWNVRSHFSVFPAYMIITLTITTVLAVATDGRRQTWTHLLIVAVIEVLWRVVIEKVPDVLPPKNVLRERIAVRPVPSLLFQLLHRI